jgi:beta-galactosidase
MSATEGFATPYVRRTGGNLLWNHEWEFQLGPYGASCTPQAATEAPSQPQQTSWERVELPHCGVEEKYDVSASFQGICWYRKRFVPTPSMRGRRVTLEFEGAMQLADVWIDGHHALRHIGGYLPFFLDLTEFAAGQRAAMITVRLDNRDNAQIPPGRPQSKLDFCYFSGLYRNVWLHITDKLHITDAIEANRVAGGGIFVRYKDVSAKSATVLVQADIANERAKICTYEVRGILCDTNGNQAATFHVPAASIDPSQFHCFQRTMTVSDPHLWSTRKPHLYTLTVQVVEHEHIIDERMQRIGIRTLRADPKLGFFLNGEHLVPSGANRHQAYPYVGNALSDQAQYRDAQLLKEAGFDIIRLCHYPQATAFLDACDELGLLTIECVPGWQFFDSSPTFRENVHQNMRDLVRRDRNHACAILWESSLNETNGNDEIILELVKIAREEYPDDQMLTCGDMMGHNFSQIPYDVPYSGWDGHTHTRPNFADGMSSLHREYGDNQFGGYSRYSRGDGETLMLVQAWGYQTALNQQMQLPYTWGQCIWEAIDNCRGGSKRIATCGAMDQFRLPKFLYAFYQSQRDPRLSSRLCDLGPFVFIANYWTAKSPRNVVVFSNCDEVELSLNGHLLERRRPDSGPDVPFGDNSSFDLDYWLSNGGFPAEVRKDRVESPIYNGGNCRSLTHPPFTFMGLAFAPGELKATGYLQGRPVRTAIRRTPGKSTRVCLRAAAEGRKFVGDGSDLILVYAEICDENGTIMPDATSAIRFDVRGPARLVGNNPRQAEAGVASILLRSTAGLRGVALSAEADGLQPATLSLMPDKPRLPSSIFRPA